MGSGHYFTRLLVLLFIVLFVCSGLYWLPDTLFGQKIKKVDLLSDIRLDEASFSLDSLQAQLDSDTFQLDSTAIRASMIQSGLIDSIDLAVRDSLYKAMYAIAGADSSGVRLEDYSIGHTGLKRFFAALNKRKTMDRPVRIAFLGDSFIEGDIVVADFRESMQKQFGGHGVGFVPITSVAAQFRPTIHQKAEGWIAHSMLTDKKQPYVLSGMVFEAKHENATLSFKTVDKYSSLKSVCSMKFIYQQSEDAVMKIVYNGLPDTLIRILPATTAINQLVLNDTVKEASLTFSNTKGLKALGIALEDNQGVVVDNYSLRGNSGLLLAQLDTPAAHSFDKIRPYDLIILQYGLNIVTEEMLHYGWYRDRMIQVVNHVKRCYPNSDVLLLGVSDRSRQRDGAFETMPSVLALLHAQRQVAKQTGIPFWNLFGAMGGENSMVRYVANNWASKDYTHLSFRGGREIATALMHALRLEKEFYDEAEKNLY